MADHAATVATIYEAFGSGDVETILGHLADDIVWDEGIRDTGLGYLRERHGKDEVAGFFPALTDEVVLTHFQPLALCVSGDYVTVPVRHQGSIAGGGEVPPTTEAHVWRFGPDGKVAAFDHVFDMAIHEQAAAKRSSGLVGRTLNVIGETFRVDVAGGQVEIFQFHGARDSGPPPHAHPWDEVYIGVAGEVEVVVEDTVTTLRAGDVVRVPGGTLHSYRIASDTATVQLVTSGHRASAFFADLDANAPAGPVTMESLPAIIDVARRNGLSSPLFA